MIKNECEYRLTKAQAARFAHTLERLEGEPGVHPRIAQAQQDALKSQLADLERELSEYRSHESRMGSPSPSPSGRGDRN